MTIHDQSYDSLAQAAKELGFSYSLIKGRIRLGWSLDEAFEITPRVTPLYGSYSEKFFKENPEAKNNPASLYFVRLKDKETDKAFQKIGITAQRLKTRFRSTRYSADIIATAEITLHEAWQWESLIVDSLSEHKYLPVDEGFAGRTECFKLTPNLVREITDIIEGIS